MQCPSLPPICPPACSPGRSKWYVLKHKVVNGAEVQTRQSAHLSSEKLSDLSEHTQWPTHLSIKASHSDTSCLSVWMESVEKREKSDYRRRSEVRAHVTAPVWKNSRGEKQSKTHKHTIRKVRAKTYTSVTHQRSRKKDLHKFVWKHNQPISGHSQLCSSLFLWQLGCAVGVVTPVGSYTPWPRWHEPHVPMAGRLHWAYASIYS